MRFLSYEQLNDEPRSLVATWDDPREGAEWLRHRGEDFQKSDLYLSNPVGQSYFVELKLAAQEPVTWSYSSGKKSYRLTVEPT